MMPGKIRAKLKKGGKKMEKMDNFDILQIQMGIYFIQTILFFWNLEYSYIFEKAGLLKQKQYARY